MLIAVTLTEILVPVVYITTLVCVALVILFLRDRIFFRRPSRKEIEDFSKKFQERLLNPDFDGLEKHFGGVFPAVLKKLYADREEILKSDFEVVGRELNGEHGNWHVCYYQPADLDNVRDAWPATKGMFEFANDGGGNGYLIDPKLDDPPVRFHEHETGEFYDVAESFSSFMAMPRRQYDD